MSLMLINPYRFVAAIPAILSFNSDVIATDQATFNHTVAIGSAAANRYIVVGTATWRGARGILVDSITINGVAMTEAVFDQLNVGASSAIYTGLYCAAVPTGDGDQTLAIEYDTSVNGHAVGVWVCENLTDAVAEATDVATGTGGFSGSISTETGDLVFGMMNGDSNPASWTGLTEDGEMSNYDGNANLNSASAASLVAASTGTLNYSGSTTGTFTAAGIGAAFR